jgi:hypothetical protein
MANVLGALSAPEHVEQERRECRSWEMVLFARFKPAA